MRTPAASPPRWAIAIAALLAIVAGTGVLASAPWHGGGLTVLLMAGAAIVWATGIAAIVIAAVASIPLVLRRPPVPLGHLPARLAVTCALAGALALVAFVAHEGGEAVSIGGASALALVLPLAAGLALARRFPRRGPLLLLGLTIAPLALARACGSGSLHLEHARAHRTLAPDPGRCHDFDGTPERPPAFDMSFAHVDGELALPLQAVSADPTSRDRIELLWLGDAPVTGTDCRSLLHRQATAHARLLYAAADRDGHACLKTGALEVEVTSDVWGFADCAEVRAALIADLLDQLRGAARDLWRP